MSTASKLKTPHDGAQAERSCWKAKVLRECHRATETANRYAGSGRYMDAAIWQAKARALRVLLKWGEGRKVRYSQREGGL